MPTKLPYFATAPAKTKLPPTQTPAQAAIGARITALRHQHGLSKRALGRRAGLSHVEIYHIETTRGGSLEALRKIATALGVSLSALLEDVG